jgi:hypothetical protein
MGERARNKGSSLPVSDAYFFVSRHEWEVASDGKAYGFYLWVMRGASQPEGKFVRGADVAEHISSDQGDGKWDVIKIPFKCFWKEMSPSGAGVDVTERGLVRSSS